MSKSLAVFLASTGALAWVYVGFPLAALIRGRLRPVQLQPAPAAPSKVTVGIAAHDAAHEIGARIENVLEQAVPFEIEVIIASDGSSDDLPAVVAELARRDPRIRLLTLPWMGQSFAQAAIFESAQGEIVVLTDAETRFAAGCLEALVKPFSDGRVGCTTGLLRWHYDHPTDTAHHEGLYWRYEQAVRQWESRAGWLTAATGAMLAVRRSAYRPVPAHASLDQLLPLQARQQGLLVLAIPDAVGVDRGSSSLSDQFRSRTRIATQGIEANLRMAAKLTPWRQPGVALAIWSHKLLRWATPWFWVLSSLAALRLAGRGWGRGLLVVPATGPATALYALVGYVASKAGRRLPFSGFAQTVMAVNTAFAISWLRVLTGRRIGRWQSGPRRHASD